MHNALYYVYVIIHKTETQNITYNNTGALYGDVSGKGSTKNSKLRTILLFVRAENHIILN